MLRPLLLVLLLIPLWGGGALAQTQFKEAVSLEVGTSTSTDIVRWADAQIVRVVPVEDGIGRYVRWGGSIVLGAALIAAGLDYFYNCLRRETGTSLDTWYRWQGIPDPI